ncbi:hypothetical protein KP509_12G042600 [Ceratopteris richardii]|uniref:Uncharacterized protein n=1 Tax=Ceratopteris richardii TaxID=49495 RepID=A0A8T2TP32_CERRI|nr:hypothetical protein KP509_12G042600 [Ceratopteris richardii]
MDELAPLDFVELRLSSAGSSRCELVVSVDGQTEKLAWGLLKTFISHLRAARELYTTERTLTLRLEAPKVCAGRRRPWFTRRTLERFVQYVSAPEVLERLQVIEQEIIQLEQIRSIQADSLPKVNHGFPNTNDGAMKAVFSPVEYNDVHGHFVDADDSKRELLRAMDVRLSTLQRERSMAFNQAIAVGFTADTMEDLLCFSDYYGAERLRVACNWFWELHTKLERVTEKPSQELPPCESKGMELGLFSSSSQIECFHDPMEVKISNMDKESFVEDSSPSSEMSDRCATVSPARLQGHSCKAYPQRSSPRRRSAPPMKKVQVGRFGSRQAGSLIAHNINYLSDRQSEDKNNVMETSSSDSEDSVQSDSQNKFSSFKRSPARTQRQNIQAAINLFENGRSIDISELHEKWSHVEQQNRRASLNDAYLSKFGNGDWKFAEDNGHIHGTEWSGRTISKPFDVSGPTSIDLTLGSNSVLASPRKHKKGVSVEIGMEGLMLHQEESSQPCMQVNVLRRDPNFRRASSTSRDLLVSELDSLEGGHIVGKKNKPIESDGSNARSTVTSVSQSETFSEVNSSSLDLKPHHSSSMSLSPSVQDQTPIFIQRSGINWEGVDLDDRECILHSDSNFRALVALAESSYITQDDLGGVRGRFYEYYRRMRDAKMEEEQSKRAEREVKLRSMEETLHLRKAEMDARISKNDKDNVHCKKRAAKLLALKANVIDSQRGQPAQEVGTPGEIVVQALPTKYGSRSGSNLPSPPLTPRMVEEQSLNMKSHRQKSASVSQDNLAASWSLSSAVPNLPKSKGTLKKESIPCKSCSSSAESNNVCVVQCSLGLKKENGKPSPGKSSGLAQVHSKGAISVSHVPVINKVSISEPNSTTILQKNSSNKNNRMDRKNRARQTRQNYLAGDMKDVSLAPKAEVLSLTSKAEVSTVLNKQKDAKVRAPIMNKIRRSAVAPIQEVRPFLKKGSGIGPGAGPGVMKLKAETARSSDEDTPGTPFEVSHEEALTVGMDMTDTSHAESMLHASEALDASGCPSSHADENQKTQEAKVDEQLRGDLFECEGTWQTETCPMDLKIGTYHAANDEPSVNAATQECHEEPVLRKGGESIATLSQLLCETANKVAQNESSINEYSEFQVSIGTEEQIGSKVSPLKAASLSSSSLTHLDIIAADYFTSTTAAILEAPVGCPPIWNSSHVNYATEIDHSQAQKTPVSSHNPMVVIVPPKEPVRGLKRLLRFGRKNRAAPDIIFTGDLPTSMHLEAENDTHNIIMKDINMQPSHRTVRKSKGRERLPKDSGGPCGNTSPGYSSDSGSVQSSRNSVPKHAPNFKLNYDNDSGSYKHKAPRSFFSLSSLWSKSSEGKSR